MSSFRFIHAADLHLGSPFQGLSLKDADVAAVVDDQFEGGRDDVLDGGDSRGDGTDVDRQEGGKRPVKPFLPG